MGEFEELSAMKKIAEALEPLDDAARDRALQWAVSRFKGLNQSVSLLPSAAVSSPRSGQMQVPASGQFAELFNAASPMTEKDKALVAAYWLQVSEGSSGFQAQALNNLLKDLGHGIGNVTEALNGLKNERPALVLQTKKSGNSRQGRKTYRLTTEGTKRVLAMTKGEGFLPG